MPEIAEVAINRDWLSSRLVGKQLHSMRFHPHSRYYNSDIANGDGALNILAVSIRNFRVVEVGSKGKLLYIHLHANQIPPMRAVVDRWLHISHGMSGGWKYPTFGGPWDGLSMYDAWSMCTAGGQETTYYDARKFGTLKVLTHEEHFEALEKLGPDVLSDSQESIFGGIGGGNLNHHIRAVLLNQNRVSGIGNYLVSEMLYRARINPNAKLGDFYTSEIQRLARVVKDTARDALIAGGCTLHSWKNPEGQPGSFQKELQVYGETHCPFMHEVKKEKDRTGRMSYWCIQCQK